MIGLVDRERVDAALYDDFETAKAREVCSILFCSFDCWIDWKLGLGSLGM
jgi:hypothetical protein